MAQRGRRLWFSLKMKSPVGLKNISIICISERNTGLRTVVQFLTVNSTEQGRAPGWDKRITVTTHLGHSEIDRYLLPGTCYLVPVATGKKQQQ